jgi:hypothetical protein
MERYRAASRERAEAVAAAAAAREAMNEPAAPKESSEAMKEDNVDPPAAEELSNPPGYVARAEEVPPSDNAPGNDNNSISLISRFSAGTASPSTSNDNNSGEANDTSSLTSLHHYRKSPDYLDGTIFDPQFDDDQQNRSAPYEGNSLSDSCTDNNDGSTGYVADPEASDVIATGIPPGDVVVQPAPACPEVLTLPDDESSTFVPVKLKPEEANQYAAKVIAGLMKQLTDDEKKTIHQSLNRRVPDNEVMVHIGKDSIQMQSFRRLGPGIWLNDEVMNLVLKHLVPALLADVCAAVPEKSPRISWVSTFYRLICN